MDQQNYSRQELKREIIFTMTMWQKQWSDMKKGGITDVIIQPTQ